MLARAYKMQVVNVGINAHKNIIKRIKNSKVFPQKEEYKSRKYKYLV